VMGVLPGFTPLLIGPSKPITFQYSNAGGGGDSTGNITTSAFSWGAPAPDREAIIVTFMGAGNYPNSVIIDGGAADEIFREVGGSSPALTPQWFRKALPVGTSGPITVNVSGSQSKVVGLYIVYGAGDLIDTAYIAGGSVQNPSVSIDAARGGLVLAGVRRLGTFSPGDWTGADFDFNYNPSNAQLRGSGAHFAPTASETDHVISVSTANLARLSAVSLAPR